MMIVRLTGTETEVCAPLLPASKSSPSVESDRTLTALAHPKFTAAPC